MIGEEVRAPGGTAPALAASSDDLPARLVAHYGAVRRFAAVAADADIDADDIVQEVFARVLRQTQRGTAPDHLEAYLRRAVMNLLANERRSLGRARAARRRSSAATPVATVGLPVYPSDVRSVLDGVDPLDRALLFLADVEGLPIADAAEVTGLSAMAARARLSRVRRRLLDEIRAEQHAEAAGGAGARRRLSDSARMRTRTRRQTRRRTNDEWRHRSPR